MAVIANRRSVMTLFSTPTDAWSHRVRLVLAEKSLNIDVIDVDDESRHGDAIDLRIDEYGSPYALQFPQNVGHAGARQDLVVDPGWPGVIQVKGSQERVQISGATAPRGQR